MILETLTADVDWHVTEVVPHGGSFRGPGEVGRFFQREDVDVAGPLDGSAAS